MTTQVLHGEQYTEVINPIPVSGTLVSTFKIVAILDKGSGAVLVVDVLSKDKATGLDILKNQVRLEKKFLFSSIQNVFIVIPHFIKTYNG